MRLLSTAVAALTLALSGALGTAAGAQTLQSHCIALVDNEFTDIRFASFGEGLSSEEVKIRYIDHSMFLIETHTGRGIVTDYNGFIGVGIVPDVVTMNHAHSSHWTRTPDPAIPHVLRGWRNEAGDGPADYRLTLDDEILIRNVTTDIRSAFSGHEENGNSIFIFEVSGLCIGHLGHLHHEPSEAQYAAIGRLDIVMAPVDGGMTLPHAVLTKMLDRMRSSLVLPMHWFGRGTLDTFLAEMSDTFEIEVLDAPTLTISLRDLPRKPTVKVLQPRFFAPDDEF